MIVECHGTNLRVAFTLVAALAATSVFPLAAHGTYDPKHGRWLQRDQLGYVDGMNLYQYAGDCPIVLTDPMGGCTSGAKGPPSCTCCCADDLGVRFLTPPKSIDYGMGGRANREHSIAIDATVSYATTRTPLSNPNCIFEWWEYSTLNLTEDKSLNRKETPAGDWYDQFVHNRDMKGQWDPIWKHYDDLEKNRDKWMRPNGGGTIVIRDDPGIRNQPSFKRDLYIAVRLADAPGCNCGTPKQDIAVGIHQHLDSAGESKIEEFKSFSAVPVMEPPWKKY